MGLIDDAMTRSQQRFDNAPRIDYERMKRSAPKLKAALTRAKNSGDAEKVAAACVKAMNEWDAIGCWPDNWSLWQCTLDDALPWNQHVDLSDLPRR